MATLDPSRTALLLMDYQQGIVGRVPDADALVARAAAALEIARRAGVTVGYVRVALDEDEVAAIPERNATFSALARRGGITPDEPATAIVAPLAPQPGDIVVRKIRIGGFSTTDLDDQLRERGLDTLVLAGISTSGVVLSTVRDAADRDYGLVVVGDLCADTDPEVHRVLIEKVFPRQADIAASSDLPRLFCAVG
jgi:nicotinamidase-related amidase